VAGIAARYCRTRLCGSHDQRCERIPVAAPCRRTELVFDGRRGLGHTPGAYSLRGAAQRMGRVPARSGIAVAQDRLQMARALLREQGQEFACEFAISIRLPVEVLEVDRGLGHARARSDDAATDARRA